MVVMRHNRNAGLTPDVMRDLIAAAGNIRRNLPRKTILLGAHAHSIETDGARREDPYQIPSNMARWSSYGRSHQLALCDHDGTNIDVTMG